MKRGRWGASLGFCLLAPAVIGALGAPYLAPFDPWQPAGAPYAAPDAAHWLGTNDLGQDLLSEVLYGLRASLLVGILAAGLATLVGTGVGLVAGYVGGALDEALMGMTDALMLVPGLPLLIVLAAYLGPGVWGVAVVIGLLWWTGTARAVRAGVLQVRQMPYMEAARALGTGTGRQLLHHVLPNVGAVVAARFVMAVPEAILTEAGLSFLGLGDPATKSLGQTLSQAFERGALVGDLWWWYAFPTLAIAAVALGVALVGLGLQEGRQGVDG